MGRRRDPRPVPSRRGGRRSPTSWVLGPLRPGAGLHFASAEFSGESSGRHGRRSPGVRRPRAAPRVGPLRAECASDRSRRSGRRSRGRMHAPSSGRRSRTGPRCDGRRTGLVCDPRSRTGRRCDGRRTGRVCDLHSRRGRKLVLVFDPRSRTGRRCDGRRTGLWPGRRTPSVRRNHSGRRFAPHNCFCRQSAPRCATRTRRGRSVPQLRGRPRTGRRARRPSASLSTHAFRIRPGRRRSCCCGADRDRLRGRSSRSSLPKPWSPPPGRSWNRRLNRPSRSECPTVVPSRTTWARQRASARACRPIRRCDPRWVCVLADRVQA